MEELKRMLFLNQKFNIMKLKIDPENSHCICDAYAYAWQNDVYPILDEGAHWHEPYENCFKVTKDMLNELLKYLAKNFDEDVFFNFYNLEDHYQARYENESNGWSRCRLIDAMRYIFLSGSFSPQFWAKLLETGRHPSEAGIICAKYSLDSMYFN